jgi:hypothetical protein
MRQDHRTDTETSWQIIARDVPLWVKSRDNISTLALQAVMWCLVRGSRTGMYGYKILQDCQGKGSVNEATYSDKVDCGLGVHPKLDLAWLATIPRLRPKDYALRGAARRPIGKRDHVTVIFDLLNESYQEALDKVRESGLYIPASRPVRVGTGPVRVALSAFVSKGGDRQRVMKLLGSDSKSASGCASQKEFKHFGEVMWRCPCRGRSGDSCVSAGACYKVTIEPCKVSRKERRRLNLRAGYPPAGGGSCLFHLRSS